jgi:small subunit ribosomal protein S8
MSTVANFFTRIRNAEMAAHSQVRLPLTKVTQALADLLVAEGYLVSATAEEGTPQGTLLISLKPGARHTYNLRSTPGRRWYVPVREIPHVRQGHGIAVISTPKGLLSGKAARKARVGGELIAIVY